MTILRFTAAASLATALAFPLFATHMAAHAQPPLPPAVPNVPAATPPAVAPAQPAPAAAIPANLENSVVKVFSTAAPPRSLQALDQSGAHAT